MESFISFVDEKKLDTKTKEVGRTLHDDTLERLREHVRKGTNVFVCGASGVGKTFMVQRALCDREWIELSPEHCRSKSNFLFFVKNTTKILLIDEFDSDATFKALIDRVSSGEPLVERVAHRDIAEVLHVPEFRDDHGQETHTRANPAPVAGSRIVRAQVRWKHTQFPFVHRRLRREGFVPEFQRHRGLDSHGRQAILREGLAVRTRTVDGHFSRKLSRLQGRGDRSLRAIVFGRRRVRHRHVQR